MVVIRTKESWSFRSTLAWIFVGLGQGIVGPSHSKSVFTSRSPPVYRMSTHVYRCLQVAAPGGFLGAAVDIFGDNKGLFPIYVIHKVSVDSCKNLTMSHRLL